MNVFAAISNILNKPFPEQESSFGAPKTLVVISVFISFFLYVFQPFGISDLESGKLPVCLGFGGMTFVATVLYDFVVGRLLKLKGTLKHWTFGKWILNNLGILFTISLANFLFARILIFGYIQWDLLPHMVYGTFMVGLIPIVALGAFSLFIQERKYQRIAEDINQKKSFNQSNEYGKGQVLLDIPVSQIKYIEALQNYVSIAYLEAEGRLDKKVERATLKNIMKEIEGSSIVRSHRSFLVNQHAIISTSGNAQGLLLELSDGDKTIPVSRSYVPHFRAR